MIRKGRFNQPAAGTAQRYGESVSFDWRLYRYDIAGSIAHAAALAHAGIIAADELQKIETELRAIEKEIESGKFGWDRSLEDVHMNIEAALTKGVAAGAKLHTARSRNDQIALDLRLYVKAEIAEVSSRLRDLQRALLRVAEKHIDLMMPGYTNLQRAQPIAIPHYLLAQIEAFDRDANRLRDCLTRADQVSFAELKKFSPFFDSDLEKIFDVRSALAKRRAIGAASPENIAGQIRRWRSELRT